MDLRLNLNDLLAISPFFILLFASLLVLITECFSKNLRAQSLYYSPGITLVAIVASLMMTIYLPQSSNPLLSDWIRFDSLATILNAAFLFIGLAATLLAISFFTRFHKGSSEYYFLLLSSLLGLLLIGSAADFLTLFLGLEILSISLYVWCGYMKNWTLSGESAMKYFLIGSLSTAFLIYGIALIYGSSGTTQFSALLEAYNQSSHSPNRFLFLAGAALITLGLCFKAAVVPFHTWAPDVYAGSPTPITAFMATGTKLGAFAALAIVFVKALPNFDPLWNQSIALLAYLTIIYANFVAIKQTQLRRFFAYSGISHAGFALIPLIAGTPEALPALLFYLAVYVLATLGAFSLLSLLDTEKEGVMLEDLRGLFYRSPLLAGVFGVCLLTLGGIPPTAGFFAKFYIFKIAFEAHYYGLVFVGIAMSILSAFYYLRIAGVVLSAQKEEGYVEGKREQWQHSWAAQWVALGSLSLIVLISLFPAPLMWILSMTI